MLEAHRSLQFFKPQLLVAAGPVERVCKGALRPVPVCGQLLCPSAPGVCELAEQLDVAVGLAKNVEVQLRHRRVAPLGDFNDAGKIVEHSGATKLEQLHCLVVTG